MPQHVRRDARWPGVPVWCLCLALTGCGWFLSEDGPLQGAITHSAEIRVEDTGPTGRLPYALVTLSPAVLSQLHTQAAPAGFRTLPEGGPPAAIRVGVGDVLTLTVFEEVAGGLFIPLDAGNRPGNYVQLPPQQVDQAGRISVPFGGTLEAVGRTPIEIQTLIQRRLANRALGPQVVVSITERHSNIVSVMGDVTLSTRFSLDGAGERVLGAIARAGGPKFPAYESYVTVQRHGQADRALLSDIGANPAFNVQLQPGDTLYVSHEPRYFLSLGATGNAQSIGLLNKRVAFEDTSLSLADALAKVGGLADDRANARAVFLYRFEPRASLAAIMGEATIAKSAALPDLVPTVFTVDLSRPDGFFLASRMMMQGEDVVFVSNAPAAELSKVLSLLLPLAYSSANFRTGF